MTDLTLYIIKSVATSMILLGFYYLIIRKINSIALMRVFLLSTLVLPLLIPLLPISNAGSDTSYLSVYVVNIEPSAVNAQISSSDNAYALTLAQFLKYLYMIVAGALLIIYISSITVLYLKRKNATFISTKYGKVLLHNSVKSPFSFFHWVFVSPEIMEHPNIDLIIKHEYNHVRLGHSYDRLIANFITAVSWFNPFLYLTRRLLSEVHEYQADMAVLKDHHDLMEYSSLLLNSTFGYTDYLVFNSTNTFSLNIKNRLFMLHHFKKQRIGTTKIVACSFLCTILLVAANMVQSKNGDQNFLTLPDSYQNAVGEDTIPPVPVVALKWLKLDKELKYEDGVVIASFYVETDGTTGEIKITKSINKEVDAFVIRKLKEIQRWEPAKYKGKPVRYLMHYPFTFKGGNLESNIKHETDVVDTDQPVFAVVEKMPEFPGGEAERSAYLSSNIVYPENAVKNKIEGTVYVSFVVRSDGSISDVKLLRGVNEEINKEALRVVTGMPKWKPGMQKGKPVDVQFNIPIKFSLEKSKKK